MPSTSPPTETCPIDDAASHVPSQRTDPTDEPASTKPPPAAEDALEQAGAYKAEGTDAFRAGRWAEALASYQAALQCLPKRASPTATGTPPGPTRENIGDEEDETSSSIRSSSAKGKGKAKEESARVEEEVVDLTSPALSAADKKTARLRAVLHANVGACFVKLGDHKEAVQACSQAILDDPAYVKARERRAASNEIIGTWTSLTSAQEDYNALLQLHTTPAQQAEVRRKLQLLKPSLEAAQKRETDEMLGKLKGLGNSILGNFGLSTDNFKFEPNGAGGYSLNFTR
ncbi:hypothetical protein BJ912DRAFT_1028781 [Pholiota molesta]|nr:hypothetical protein BJ912DRAFT_1028781 [Pholiota molesta]